MVVLAILIFGNGIKALVKVIEYYNNVISIKLLSDGKAKT